MWLHLLLRLHAVAVPSVPPPRTANTNVLQQRLQALPPGGALTLEPGKYVFSNASLMLQGLRDVVVDGAGAELMFYYGFGVQISGSHNCTFRGFSLDSQPPNYAQGSVESVSGAEFTAMFDDAFIPPAGGPFRSAGGLSGAKVAFWDTETRRMLPLGNQFLVNATSIDGGKQWRVRLKTDVRGARAGVAVTVFPRRGITWNILNSSAITTDGVSIHAGGNMGFHEQGGAGGNKYTSVTIARKAGSAGLLALNADGFHSSDVGVGPALLDSEISFTGDGERAPTPPTAARVAAAAAARADTRRP